MDHGLVRGLRAAGFDVVTVAEVARRSLSDDEQLLYAASVERVLYTCNIRDFPRLHASWIGGGQHHAGIIVLADQATGVGVQIRALLHLAAARDATTMRDQIAFLSNWVGA